MKRPIIAVAIAIGLSAVPALAQDSNQSPGNSQASQGSGPQVTMTGPNGDRRGPPPGRGQDGASVELKLGDDVELQVECGTTPLQDCLEATTPYLDMLRQMQG